MKPRGTILTESVTGEGEARRLAEARRRKGQPARRTEEVCCARRVVEEEARLHGIDVLSVELDGSIRRQEKGTEGLPNVASDMSSIKTSRFPALQNTAFSSAVGPLSFYLSDPCSNAACLVLASSTIRPLSSCAICLPISAACWSKFSS